MFSSPVNKFQPSGHHAVTKAILRRHILNHKSNGSSADINEAAYNWHKYENEIRSILNAWENQLLAITEGKTLPVNVISLNAITN